MNGLLLIDKPAGITSHDVVHRVRRSLGVATRKTLKLCRVGHAGTLDPFATGLLILGLGQATKQLGQLLGLDKTYEAELRLGATSDTFDVEGTIKIQDTADSTEPTLTEIETTLDLFRGGYAQKAPLHSAKKLGGKKLYDLARSGKATEEMRPTKQVMISELVVLDYAWPILRLRVSCSSGTYIRSLGDDIGAALKTGAYLTALRRIRIGTYHINDATTLDALQNSETISAHLKTT